MNENRLDGISKGLRYLLLAVAFFYVAAYLDISFPRLQYPFELEWEEGGSVDHVRMILSDKNLYEKPSLEFIAYIYTPLYYYLSALLAMVTGVGFLPLRLVSFGSSLGCFVLIFFIVKQETEDKFSAAVAAGLFAATFKISGVWFDIARVDSLFLFFMLAALYVIRLSTSIKGHVLAGVLISLSFLTKQTALVISLPIMLHYILFNRRHAPFFIGTVVGIIGASSLLLNNIYDGWYYHYVFHIPGKLYYFMPDRLSEYWTKDLMAPMHIACVMAISYLVFAKNSEPGKKNYLFYLFAAAGMVGGAWSSRLHGGGFDNVLFPAYAVISILFGLAINMIIDFIRFAPKDKRKPIEVFIYIICIIQFACLKYDFNAQIPTQKDREAGMAFIDIMKQIEGEIFVPTHPYIPMLAGKKSHAHSLLVGDMLADIDGEAREHLIKEIRQAIRKKRFSAIILDSTKWREPFRKVMRKNYRRDYRIQYEDNDVFLPGNDVILV